MESTITDQIPTGQSQDQNQTDTAMMMAVDTDPQINNMTLSNVLPTVKKEYSRVLVPENRLKPLKENWPTIVKVLVEHMKIQMKMNLKKKSIEMRTGDSTVDPCAIRKCEDFLKAYMCGFDLQDAIAMLRLEDLYLETFLIKDVKANLHGDHLSRCIGRICGEKGKTKNAIENATRTRIIVQDQKIHILGSHTNTRLARNSLCSLILGAPPGKVYSSLRIIGKKVNEI